MLTPTETAKLACGTGAQPAFTGGALTAGTYNVATVDIYPPDGGADICGFLGAATVKGAATVTANQLQLVLNVTGALTKTIGIDGSYTENSDMLTVTPTCGASSSSVETVLYTATASTLVIDAQIMGYTGLVTLDLAQ
jgi:thiamine monophosphate kinase